MTASTISESRSRVGLSRAFSCGAVFLLYWTSDTLALASLAVGILIYYIPNPAAAPCVMPKWIRTIWIMACLAVALAYFSTDIAPPQGSIVPPVLGYGSLLLLAVQILWDFVRYRTLRSSQLKTEQGADGDAEEAV